MGKSARQAADREKLIAAARAYCEEPERWEGSIMLECSRKLLEREGVRITNRQVNDEHAAA